MKFILFFFGPISFFSVDLVWLYFFVLFDWCADVVGGGVVATDIELLNSLAMKIIAAIVHTHHTRAEKKHTSAKAKISTLHNQWIRWMFFFSWFSTLCIHKLLCTRAKVHWNNWWNVWLFIYVAMFHVWTELSLFMYIIPFIFMMRVRKNQQQQQQRQRSPPPPYTNLNFGILLFANDGCRNHCSSFRFGMKFGVNQT